jgi:hypothetical protein
MLQAAGNAACPVTEAAAAAAAARAHAASLLLTVPSHAPLRSLPPDDAMLGVPPSGGDDRATPQPQTAPSSPRELVLACADRVHRGDVDGARRVLEALLSVADPRGDAADRLAHHFARALARRVDGNSAATPAAASSPSAYLSYNQIAPFLRFGHLTANQAILEAAFTAGGEARRVLHVVDLDAAYGVQWPPLLQAIAELADPPEVRITGVGTDRDMLRRTGDRLRDFADSLNLPFRFHPLLLPSCPAHLAAGLDLELHPDETLAVNCVLFLHRLSGEGELARFLRWLKSLNPAVVTVAEREATIGGGDCPDDDLPRRVAAAVDYYAPVFDALEAMVPPGSAERLVVEREVLGGEIDAVVGPGPADGGFLSRRFEWWALAARDAGLSPRPLSAFALSQARFLLRLHYPSEGYVAEEARGACFLRWQTRPLMSVSSWQ